MIACSKCQHQNPDGARFCNACAAPLEVVCPACGHVNPASSRFCNRCAALVSAPRTTPQPRFSSPQAYTPPHLAEKILTSKSALEGERKQVTVLFADLVSSTVLAERLGPDAMHGLLNRFFEIALDEVHRYEGTINQFLGDGFMALFGAPVAHEDHARRAVLAAVGFQDTLRREGNGLVARIGINTGLVVVGAIGDNLRMDYTAVGDTTNLAARLQQLAEPGTILAADTTVRGMRGAVRVEALPPTTVKGKDEKITPYRVLGLAARRSRLEVRPERELSRFVGRDRELDALERLFDQAVEGHGQVVGIVGEPGLGKSRLLLEFRRTLGNRQAAYIEGRCLSYGTTTPYLPILDIVRMSSGIAEADTPEMVGAKVRQTLAALGVAGDDAAPCLLHLLGIKDGSERVAGLNPETLKARIFAALDEMALRSSRRQPLALVVEDLHWVDRTSESYLATLVDALAGAPILLVTTYRPGYQPPWLGKSYATQIALRPLGPRDDRTILESVLRGHEVSDSVVERIVEKAEGNPFFLEELARAVAEGEMLTSIPETVQDVLMARIDRLPEQSKRLLQTAAVIGRHMSPRLLSAVWTDPATLATSLQDLKRLEFMYEERRAAEPALTFKHVLTQEVAYESVVLSRRRSLHAAVGVAFERLYAGQIEQIVDRLAHHYARTDESLKAVQYLTRVAEKATRSLAHAEAVATLDEATTHAARLPGPTADRWFVKIAVIKAEALHYLGRRPESVELLLAQEERRARVDDLALSACYFFRLGYAYSFLGDRQRAPETLERALDAALRCGDRVTAGGARTLLALECYFSGDPRQGTAHGREAVTLLLGTDARSALGTAYVFLGINQEMLGELQAVRQSSGHAEAIGRELSDRRLTCLGVVMRASEGIGWTQGWDQAIRASEEALALAPDAFEAALCIGILGHTLLRSGRVEEAIARLEPAVVQADRYRSIQVRSWFRSFLGEAYAATGRVDEARVLANEALEMARSARHPLGIALAERTFGLVARAAGRLGDARQWFRASLATSESLHNRVMQALDLLHLAELDVVSGDRAGSAAHLARAHALAVETDAAALVDQVKERARSLGVEIAS